MTKLRDSDIRSVIVWLRNLRKQYGWRQSLRSLKKAAGEQDRVAVALLNDYTHLVDNGLLPHQAIHTVLAECCTDKRPS
jgi:hypothetical protein